MVVGARRVSGSLSVIRSHVLRRHLRVVLAKYVQHYNKSTTTPRPRPSPTAEHPVADLNYETVAWFLVA